MDTILHVRVNAEVAKRLRVYCAEIGRKIGEVVAEAIEEKLRRYGTVDEMMRATRTQVKQPNGAVKELKFVPEE
jgi:predicted DNA-binding protein